MIFLFELLGKLMVPKLKVLLGTTHWRHSDDCAAFQYSHGYNATGGFCLGRGSCLGGTIPKLLLQIRCYGMHNTNEMISNERSRPKTRLCEVGGKDHQCARIERCTPQLSVKKLKKYFSWMIRANKTIHFFASVRVALRSGSDDGDRLRAFSGSCWKVIEFGVNVTQSYEANWCSSVGSMPKIPPITRRHFLGFDSTRSRFSSLFVGE